MWKVGEIIEFEKVTGLRFADIGDENAANDLPFAAAAAFVWLAERRENPNLTYEDVLQYDVSDLDDKVGLVRKLSEASNPTKGEG